MPQSCGDAGDLELAVLVRGGGETPRYRGQYRRPQRSQLGAHQSVGKLQLGIVRHLGVLDDDRHLADPQIRFPAGRSELATTVGLDDQFTVDEEPRAVVGAQGEGMAPCLRNRQ